MSTFKYVECKTSTKRLSTNTNVDKETSTKIWSTSTNVDKETSTSTNVDYEASTVQYRHERNFEISRTAREYRDLSFRDLFFYRIYLFIEDLFHSLARDLSQNAYGFLNKSQ